MKYINKCIFMLFLFNTPITYEVTIKQFRVGIISLCIYNGNRTYEYIPFVTFMKFTLKKSVKAM